MSEIEKRLARGERGIPKIPDSPDTRHAQPPTIKPWKWLTARVQEAMGAIELGMTEGGNIGLFRNDSNESWSVGRTVEEAVQSAAEKFPDGRPYAPARADTRHAQAQRPTYVCANCGHAYFTAARPAEQPAPPLGYVPPPEGYVPLDEATLSQPSAPPQPAAHLQRRK